MELTTDTLEKMKLLFDYYTDADQRTKPMPAELQPINKQLYEFQLKSLKALPAGDFYQQRDYKNALNLFKNMNPQNN